jgi:dihydropyrimidine dehydrogenase (NAD+) subunit PreA
MLRFGDIRGAAEAIRRANVFGATCARLCSADSPCRSHCLRGQIDKPVDIPTLQAYAVQAEQQLGVRPLPVGPDRGRSVAVVGAGPAGLTAAAELRRLGHRVALFEQTAEVGGHLIRSIPPYVLPRELVQREIDAVLATGVDLHLEQAVDSLDELLADFDAVLVAVGLGRVARLGVDGEDLEGVYSAESVLQGEATEVGLRPMVVGGGNRAMYAATSALRLAGPNGRVALLYRRSEQQMPAFARERREAAREGVVFRPLTVVERILGDRNGRVAAVRCRAVDLGPPDGTGRPGPVELSGGSFDLQASSMIVAAGELPDVDLLENYGLTEAEPRGDQQGRTDRDKLYVAGEILGAGRTVSSVVGSAVRAAAAIDYDLRSGSERTRLFPVLGPRATLSVDFLGHPLPHPFLLAAAPCTNDLEMARAGLQAGWAGLVFKTVAGWETAWESKYPLMQPLADGPRMLAALGNIDQGAELAVDAVTARLEALKDEFPDRFFVASIVAEGRPQWQRLTRQFVASGIDAIECCLAGPQGTLGSEPGAVLGDDAKLVRTVTQWVKDVAGQVPVTVKLAPSVADPAEIAAAAVAGGADAIVTGNGHPGLAGIDLDQVAPLPVVGGQGALGDISGPAVLPFALRATVQVARAVSVPVCGGGGVESWRDAAAMMMAGARVVQVCSAVMAHGFDVLDSLTQGLAQYVEQRQLGGAAALVGEALPRVVSHQELVQPGPVRARIDEESCVGCGRCFIACRDGGYRAIAWQENHREPAVSLERCVGCGLCAGVCPSDSISYLTLGR